MSPFFFGASSAVGKTPFTRVTSAQLGRAIQVVVLAACLWGFAWSATNSLAGARPSLTHPEATLEALGSKALGSKALGPESLGTHTLAKTQLADLAGLYEIAIESGHDTASLKTLALTLSNIVSSAQEPVKPVVVVEALNLLQELLSRNPHDAETLRAMAELSFSQKVFDRAAFYYNAYLQLHPNDISTRSNYASALTFAGETDRALKELDSVLAVAPEHFHATVYLAIAHAQKGEAREALLLGERALQYAPTEDARKRLATFLEGIREKQTDEEAAPKNSENKNSENMAPFHEPPTMSKEENYATKPNS